MPNWCENTLTVSGPKERLEEFKQMVAGDEEALDAEKIIPYPAMLAVLDKLSTFHPNVEKMKPVIPTEQDNQLLMEAALAGYDTKRDGFNQGGYEWCVQNWGTKWNFCEVNVEFEERPRVSKLYYTFSTAWSPPNPLIRKMGEMFPGLNFTLKYWEGGAGYQGELRIRKGEVAIDLDKEYCGSRGG